jgi:hypothetical protein
VSKRRRFSAVSRAPADRSISLQFRSELTWGHAVTISDEPFETGFGCTRAAMYEFRL